LGTAPDVLLLHNPDFLLSASRERAQVRALAHDIFHQETRRAFAKMEELVSSGAIGHCYGVSTNPCGTWWSASGRRNGYEAPSLPRMLADAAAVGGGRDGHKLRVLQVPLNALELGAAMGHYDPALPPKDAVAGGVLPSALRVASNHGVGVMVNRPLHAIPPPGFLSGDWARADNRSLLKLRQESPQPPALALIHSILAQVSATHACAHAACLCPCSARTLSNLRPRTTCWRSNGGGVASTPPLLAPLSLVVHGARVSHAARRQLGQRAQY
jgi:hypothetical protein